MIIKWIPIEVAILVMVGSFVVFYLLDEKVK